MQGSSSARGRPGQRHTACHRALSGYLLIDVGWAEPTGKKGVYWKSLFTSQRSIMVADPILVRSSPSKGSQ